jgi:hypothetical protein
MANNNNSGASSLEKATKLPTNSSVCSTFGSPSALNTPLYNVAPKSSSECMGGKETKPSVIVCGGKPDLDKQIKSFVASYPTATAGYGGAITTTTSTAGYGGPIAPVTPISKDCKSKEGGKGELERDEREGDDDRKSNKSSVMLPKGKETIGDKCSKVVGMVTGLFTPAPTNVVAASGYGGPIAPTPVTTVSASGYGGFIGSNSGVGQKCVHFNQGIGNGSEGGDPGKSAPRGGSNDEGGRKPGQRPC